MTHLTPVPAVDGPRNPLIPVSWVITFGIGHPLAKRYVRVAGPEEHARHLMSEIFGPGGWGGIYRDDMASRVIDSGRLTELDLGFGSRPDLPKPELIEARAVRDPLVGLIGLIDHARKYTWAEDPDVAEFLKRLGAITEELARAMPENQQ
jgi:hypothetical protein